MDEVSAEAPGSGHPHKALCGLEVIAQVSRPDRMPGKAVRRSRRDRNTAGGDDFDREGRLGLRLVADGDPRGEPRLVDLEPGEDQGRGLLRIARVSTEAGHGRFVLTLLPVRGGDVADDP